MIREISQLTLRAPKLAREQIRDHVREIILSGQMKPGDRIPSTADLARQWATHVPTVHAALSGLVKEGLLDRYPGKGTYVAERTRALTCVGIYYGEDIWTKRVSAFLLSLHAALKEQLTRMGIQTDVWIDTRSSAEQTDAWLPLERAATQHRIQAVIATCVDWPHMKWLDRLAVPVSYLSTANVANKVTFDQRQLAELSLRRLAEQGCRSVGLISGVPSNVLDADGSPNDITYFLRTFLHVAGELGLTIRDSWMRLAEHEHALRGVPRAQYGYRQFRALWDQPEHPDGLLVDEDAVAAGALMALVELGVRVPEELKLVLHKNEGVDLLCPVPATFAVSDETQLAGALIEQVQKQFRGERCEPIRLPYRLSTTARQSPAAIGTHQATRGGREEEGT